MTHLKQRMAIAMAIAGMAAGASAQTPAGRLYAPGAFDQFEVEGAAVIKLTQGPKDQVFVAGDDDVQKAVEVELQGHRLMVHPSGTWKFWNNDRLRIEVQMRQLKELNLAGASDLHAVGPIKSDRLDVSISGAGEVRFDDLTAGQLRFDISGAGSGTLAGQVDALELNVSGKGRLRAEQLRARRGDVSISGVGDANLWVSDNLAIDISGIGHVDYWGHPDVKRSSSGMGTINARGDKH